VPLASLTSLCFHADKGWGQCNPPRSETVALMKTDNLSYYIYIERGSLTATRGKKYPLSF
jgi:hypothetical protein